MVSVHGEPLAALAWLDALDAPEALPDAPPPAVVLASSAGSSSPHPMSASATAPVTMAEVTRNAGEGGRGMRGGIQRGRFGRQAGGGAWTPLRRLHIRPELDPSSNAREASCRAQPDGPAELRFAESSGSDSSMSRGAGVPGLGRLRFAPRPARAGIPTASRTEEVQ
jgi:hypothetical protein